ncbi:RNA polymerase sigma factor [Streptomyces parvus]|uniref:Sigma-70 family RNA polymerase sigma factor n=1 Tax=Streptomyces parvus TaxID=66428 RepID=A0A5D4HVJ3_9ACTN|nr:sigma factor [Streptomyces parvus]TYR44818.1 sigma-70 family RNA polymerase sigma factor [Streptomyces parvus]
MSPGDGGGSEAGHTYLTKLGNARFDALMKQVIASLAGFEQLNAAEREDVASEAVYHAVSRKQFDPSDQPVAYIKTIARNMALKKIEELKSRKRKLRACSWTTQTWTLWPARRWMRTRRSRNRI